MSERPNSQGAGQYTGDTPILLFSKIPGERPCKTRLLESSDLNTSQITSLALAFLFDTLETVLATSLGPLYLSSDPVASASELHDLSQQLTKPIPRSSLCRLHYLAQSDQPFDSRLLSSIRMSKSTNGLVVLCSDWPTLSP